MSTLKVTNIKHDSSSSNNITVAADGSATAPVLKPGTYTTSGRPADPADGTFIYNSDDKEMQWYGDEGGWRNFSKSGDDISTIIDGIGGDASTYLKWCCDANGPDNTAATIKDLSGNGNNGTNSNMGFTSKSGSTGGYWTFNGDSGNTNSNLGTALGQDIANTDSQFAICAWIYSVDWSDMPNNTWWILNDGDWTPDGQIGFRCVEAGTSGTVEVRCAAGDDNFSDSSDNASTGWPADAGWAFVATVRTGNSFSSSNQKFQNARAFPGDTNVNLFKDLTGKGFAGSNSSYSLYIGGRPDNLSQDNAQGDRLGLMALWVKTSTSTPMDNPTTWFETIFDKTKARYT